MLQCAAIKKQLKYRIWTQALGRPPTPWPRMSPAIAGHRSYGATPPTAPVDYLHELCHLFHRVTHPEITVTGDTATGIWYPQDRVIVAKFNFVTLGAAFYHHHDQYRRTTDGGGSRHDRTCRGDTSLQAGPRGRLTPNVVSRRNTPKPVADSSGRGCQRRDHHADRSQRMICTSVASSIATQRGPPSVV